MSDKEEKNKKVTCLDIDGKKHVVGPDELSFRPSVYGILIEKGKVLLVKQWDGYDFPGGGIDIHETIEGALKREFWEETGLDIKPVEIVSVESSFFRLPYSEEYVNAVLMYFLCEKIGGKVSAANFDEHEQKYASEAEWIDLGDVEKLKFYNSVDSLKVLEKAMRSEKLLKTL